MFFINEDESNSLFYYYSFTQKPPYSSVCNYYVKPKPNCVEPCSSVVTPFGHWMCQKRKAVEFSKETTWDVQFFYYMFDSRWQHMTKNDTNLVSIRYWKILTHVPFLFMYIHIKHISISSATAASWCIDVLYVTCNELS